MTIVLLKIIYVERESSWMKESQHLGKRKKLIMHTSNMRFWEFILFFVYKHLLEFLLFPTYLQNWGYMFDGIWLRHSLYRILVSDCILTVIILAYMINKAIEDTYDFSFKLLMCMAIIPCLALYAVNSNLPLGRTLYPSLYFFVFALLINKPSKNRGSITIRTKKIKHIDSIVLLCALLFTVLLWAYLGFPVTISLSDTYDQRMYMRTMALPSIVNYLYLMLGNAVIPYLFVKSLLNKKKIKTIISLVNGLLLFFLNGMKTWLLLYVIGICLFLCARVFCNEYRKIIFSIETFFCCAVALSWGAYKALGSSELLGQLGRILFIPANIGYKSVEFFSDPSHELL